MSGGARFFSSSNMSTGVFLQPGGGAWDTVSDARLKENFRDVSGEDVLAKLATIPIRGWNYRAQSSDVRHVGPTAQDFHAAFGLGGSGNEFRINTVDADGIAMAAVQALEQRTRRLDDERRALQDALTVELMALRAEVAHLREALRAGTRR